METVTSVVLWSFLPSLTASIIQGTIYAVGGCLFKYKPPTKNTSVYQFHYKCIMTLMLTLYLFTQMLGAHPRHYFSNSKAKIVNYYEMFDLTPSNFSNAQLKSAFKVKARSFHPDKIDAHTNPDDFIQYRKAYEVLSDEQLRFAYDRFGPEALEACGLEKETKKSVQTVQCKTRSEFIHFGWFHTYSTFYLSFLLIYCIHYFMIWIYKSKKSRKMKYFEDGVRLGSLFFILFIDAVMITRDQHYFSHLFGWLQFEWIHFLHQFFIHLTFYVSFMTNLWQNDLVENLKFPRPVDMPPLPKKLEEMAALSEQLTVTLNVELNDFLSKMESNEMPVIVPLKEKKIL